jgi:transcriptional regulator with XRE-family HTH domain
VHVIRTEAEITPSVLAWARRSIGLKTEDAARRLKVPKDKIEGWERGIGRPSIPQAEKLAALYKRPLAVFYMPAPPTEAGERVRSTFMEDFRAFIEEKAPKGLWEFDWRDPKHDPEGKYIVDCRMNGMAKPLYIFALPGDDKVRDATIAILQFERWKAPFRSVAIFEDQEEVNRKVLARFSDVCEKQFSSLAANRDRIERFLKEALSA